ncbi:MULTISPECIES: TonB-dependent receptor [Olivibacter]|uniref:TonB-dependent receptor domain-containing protein n=1 Tax=Olivibacter jilunii TaxID=985016 RepID=A0ABW6AWY4_9SPHI|nr:carboxypeptidase regulatory-like domain-containing protein [Olivibacter sp. UJ_SKK_5.1]MDX3913032.1 carboxypeptidase regulatory-like domain-containing protein [Pseudosphingobacterium sp.]
MKKFLLSFILLLGTIIVHAQVTTSSMTGTVTDNETTIPGASIKATHVPSGTVYGTSTNNDGKFSIYGMRVGGPYKVEVTYVGYNPVTYSDISLRLGESFQLNVNLSQDTRELDEIVITANAGIKVVKTGASTSISNREINTLPTISRSITDFTRLTPQSNGNSFGGRDARYNNIQIDGANLNNNFGLSNDPLPGGGAQPISLDAYDQISVNIAPYDVRQSGFTGAGITATTKSGTNTFHGSAYTFFRNQSFIGKKVGDSRIDVSDSKNNVYGLTLGGPIIKNKLFFFVSGEYEKGERPGVTFKPTGGQGSGNTSTTTVEDLQRVSDFLRNQYGYNPGAFDQFPNFTSSNHKILGKIDWNINDNHKLTVKYSDFVGNDDQLLNRTSVPNGGGFSVTGATGTLSRLPYDRFGNNSMAFANSNYGFKNITRSGTAELNSKLGSNMSNQLLLTFTRNKSTRTFDGGVFPSVDIFNGQGGNFLSFGMDPYTNNNDVVNDIYSVTDNFTYNTGKHTITAGVSYEYQKVGNMFMAGSNSYYVYNTLDDFLNQRSPVYYAYTYSLVPGQKNVYSAELKIGQLGIYAQDEFDIASNFKLTYGIRGDLPIYLEKPLENPAIQQLQFYDKNGQLTSYNGNWPKSKLLLSPRAGFRWDVLKDESLIVRGGTGIFTGRIPFVWLTNMPTNSGMYQFGASIRTGDPRLNNIVFNPNPDAYANLFPTEAGTSVPSNIVLMDPDFKFPSVFRSNLAVERNLGNGFVASVEALYSRDINAIRMFNANNNPTDRTIYEGDLQRPGYSSSNARNLNSLNTAIVLANSDKKGYSTSLTAQLTKNFHNGLYGSVAYTYTKAKEITANPGSQASSVWNLNPNVGTSNAQELGLSQYAIPHRIVGSVSYRKEYAKNFASTLSLFYEGSHQGNYSFIVNGDVNGDGNSSADLMYIPRDANDIIFSDILGSNDNVLFTAQQQAEAFDSFISNSSYLKKHRGEFAGRNAALLPWFNRVDLRFLQDFYIQAGERRHTLQFSVDILNFTNMLNKNWGVKNLYVTNNPLRFRSVNEEGRPVYQLQQLDGQLVNEVFMDDISTNSTWSMQLGLRYIF